jgi:hypothetical protein
MREICIYVKPFLCIFQSRFEGPHELPLQRILEPSFQTRDQPLVKVIYKYLEQIIYEPF